MATDSLQPHDARLTELLRKDRALRVVGFDDAPFERHGSDPVAVAGVICTDDRFEGMVWGHVTPDGHDATDTIAELLEGGKFHSQLHLILLDGIALGGFNVIDVPHLSTRLDLPVVTIMRQSPDWPAIEAALQNVDDPVERLATMHRAGPIHEGDHIYFQAVGISPDLTRAILPRLTRQGHIPEPIRIAHLIAGAVATGESGRRA